MQFYSAYGLVIESALPLPELTPVSGADGTSDVAIEFGDVPERTPGSSTGEVAHHWHSNTSFLLAVPNVGSFLVTDGKRIAIQPLGDASDDGIRLCILGSALAALLIQRGLLLLHGNSVRLGQNCMICVGASGSGKSSLAAGFMLRGFRVLADDVVPITVARQAVPGFPRIKIWQDLADKLAISTNGLRRILPGFDKFSLPIEQEPRPSPLPVKWVYILSPEDRNDIQIEALCGHHRFQALFDHTYRNHYLHGMPDLRSRHLQICSALARGVHIAMVRRPKAGFQLQPLLDALLTDAKQNG